MISERAVAAYFLSKGSDLQSFSIKRVVLGNDRAQRKSRRNNQTGCRGAANISQVTEPQITQICENPISTDQRLSVAYWWFSQVVLALIIDWPNMPGSYVWTWKTTLIALRDVQSTRSVWGVPSYCSQQFGYCGLGVRLASDLFQDGEVLPAGTKCGSTPACVSFRGNGVELKFDQDAQQANALFVSTYQAGGPYPGGPGFAYLCLVPRPPRDLKQGTTLECNYVITVSDV